MKTYVSQPLKDAIKSVVNFLPAYIPEVEYTQVFNLGYGKLKLWRVTNELVWAGFIYPYKHNPLQDNIAHLTPDELVSIARGNL